MTSQAIRDNTIIRLSIEFSLAIIEYCDLLESNKKFVLARQLFRSATAIGANAMEAQNAESKNDFLHKFKIAAKEAEETQYWLLLCKMSNSYPNPVNLLHQLEALHRLIGKIISTTRKELDRNAKS
jgi:four helix bundle protein